MLHDVLQLLPEKSENLVFPFILISKYIPANKTNCIIEDNNCGKICVGD